jgi:GT2 family glycosyltransferase
MNSSDSRAGRLRSALRILREGASGLRRKIVRRLSGRPIDYPEWAARYDTLDKKGRRLLEARLATLKSRPLLSVLLCAHGDEDLRRSVASVVAQVYPDWELHIAWTGPGAPEVPVAARAHVFARAQEHEALNAALAAARGELIVLLEGGDELSPHALFRLAEEVSRNPGVAAVYSDEDRIDEKGRRSDPWFKPDFNPEALLSQNVFAHLCAYRTALVTGTGGFRPGVDASYDLMLRVSQLLPPGRVSHLRQVLYHRRSPADPARERAALQDHVHRFLPSATLEPARHPGIFRVRHPLPDPAPLVTIVIPTRDGLSLLQACIESIRERTRYPRYEIVVVDNASTRPGTLRYLDALREGATVLHDPLPFNFSRINNLAARAARGEVLAFVNDDVEVIDPDWLRELVSQAVRPGVGAAGARLLYPDGRVQHAGIALGLGPDGVAGTPHRGLPRASPGYHGRALAVQEVSAVTAACLVIRKDAFEQVGGFDERAFPVSYNDVDLCVRLHDAGLRVVYAPSAELFHKESASRGDDVAPEKRARLLEEASRMHERYGERLRDDPFYNPNLSLDTDTFELADPPRSPRPWEPLRER